MSTSPPRIFNIAPDKPFLEVLADAVLAGFPKQDGAPPTPLELTRWTILLPTRRAVRELEQLFFEKSGSKGIYLPAIKPIGDIDEDGLLLVEDSSPLAIPAAIPAAMSPAGQLLVLIDLIDDWARDNPQTRLAQEVAHAPHQAYALALSLKDFLDAVETEDADVSRIPELYGLESARHREAILEFLAIARERYPQRLMERKLVSPALRRSLVLRHEARRLEQERPLAPIIAAGSTGSIAATRDLLKAIAGLTHGAVVLPGLDTLADDESWATVEPPHPQHALKQLMTSLAVDRSAVVAVPGGEAGRRSWLASEIMRPADTSDHWRDTIAENTDAITEAMDAVELIEASHLQEEAAVIALILRNALEAPGKTASLVTPDRQLARRVKTELQRWDIAIDDSGGEPLLKFGGASLLHLLIDAISEEFSPETLASLLRHPMCRLGRAPEAARHAVSIIELAVLRSDPGLSGLAALSRLLREKNLNKADDRTLHAALKRLLQEDWDEAIAYAQDVTDALLDPQPDGTDTLGGHLDRLVRTGEALAGPALWEGDAGEALAEVVAILRQEAAMLRQCSFARAAAIIRHLLQSTALRPRNPRQSRLSILGLLEARLMRPDLAVLGGLNEGAWPGLPDAGPWLNRPMRDTLGMQQPERSIGQTAHDFVQGFGATQVKLVWSRRIGDAPAIPSRWLLRLQMILKAAGLKERMGTASPWVQLCRQLNEPSAVVPHGKPRPKPPVAARPTRLSVTRIETLIRDPYAIYARHVLGLEPVDPIAAAPDPSRRGIIFHGAIGDFLNAYPLALPPDPAADLIAFGDKHFQALKSYPDITSFWWPRFVRIAHWLTDQEQVTRAGLRRVVAEINGWIELQIAEKAFQLSCRADRIDLLKDGTARIVDYKTGSVPSAEQVKIGLAPQLTLQAAILEGGGFETLGPLTASDLVYVKLGGGEPAGDVKQLKLDPDVMTVAHAHLGGLKTLLTQYSQPSQAYLPRAMVEKEDEARDYDHLSRYREWALAGQAK